jgi:Ca2+-transporting ATPase
MCLSALKSPLGALFWATRGLGLDGEATVSVPPLAVGQIRHVFNMRQPASGVLANEGTRARYGWAAVGVCVLLLFGAVYIPGVGHVLEVQPPSAAAWGLIALMRLVPLAVGQVVVGVRRRLRTSGEKGTAVG